jgi:adenylate kinase family enzyme
MMSLFQETLIFGDSRGHEADKRYSTCEERLLPGFCAALPLCPLWPLWPRAHAENGGKRGPTDGLCRAGAAESDVRLQLSQEASVESARSFASETQSMKRIVIVGSGGSGKSTLAQQIGSALGLEVIHLDSVFWKPGWVRASEQEQQAILDEAVKHQAWIIDGDHLRTQDLRFAAADTIIFLDYPRALCVWRTIKRFLQYRGTNRTGVAAGCPERLNWTLLKWVWRYPVDNRSQVIENIKRYSEGRQVIVLRDQQAVKQFTRSLTRSTVQE